MERALVDAHRDAVRRATEAQAQADEAQLHAEAEAAMRRQASKEEEIRSRARRAIALRMAAVGVLSLLSLLSWQSRGSVSAALLSVAVTLLVLPAAWLPSPPWSIIRAGAKSVMGNKPQTPPQFSCPITVSALHVACS